MRTRVRPIFVFFLCGVLLLGHIPAWMHAAACHDLGHWAPADIAQHQVSDADSHCDHCHSGCHTRTSQRAENRSDRHAFENGDWFEQDTHHNSHDSRHCVVCQSLVGSVLGASFDDSVRLPPDVCSFRICAFPIGYWTADQLLIQQPRGPPSA
jgi:hypothetical protein